MDKQPLTGQELCTLWQQTVKNWQEANGFRTLTPPDINQPYTEMQGEQQACIDAFARKINKWKTF